ncbi:MAG: hypothetical protein AB7E47_16230 [Desulfovibrionaceae bacterium]
MSTANTVTRFVTYIFSPEPSGGAECWQPVHELAMPGHRGAHMAKAAFWLAMSFVITALLSSIA